MSSPEQIKVMKVCSLCWLRDPTSLTCEMVGGRVKKFRPACYKFKLHPKYEV